MPFIFIIPKLSNKIISILVNNNKRIFVFLYFINFFYFKDN
ncbi:hypothetical protein M8044_000147 [Columbia Basin potato purple top phytoplasma]|uniref:Uncharacterized protein n=1 Tax=Columbia Basin potato purple top phytoplasma TaxID=307134 RepID=A0ABT5L8P3_9MOLU|nr:hypothetical protein [Columbia Basin potato purple top phytoplasma]